jgi:hypothetical protein
MPNAVFATTLLLLALLLLLPSPSLSCGDEICAVNAEEGVINSGQYPPFAQRGWIFRVGGAAHYSRLLS